MPIRTKLYQQEVENTVLVISRTRLAVYSANDSNNTSGLSLACSAGRGSVYILWKGFNAG